MKVIYIKKLRSFLFLSAIIILFTSNSFGKIIVELVLPSGSLLKTHLALTEQDKNTGLSGQKAINFSTQEGMLFLYKKSAPRVFWMPDTYFDLDIFFLDQNLKIIDVQRSLKAHPGRKTPPTIERTKKVISWHVLEIRSDSKNAKSLKKGQKLIWQSSAFPLEKVLNTHLSQ